MRTLYTLLILSILEITAIALTISLRKSFWISIIYLDTVLFLMMIRKAYEHGVIFPSKWHKLSLMEIIVRDSALYFSL